MIAALRVTSAALCAPGMTETTCLWPSGNFSAASISLTPWLSQTRSMRATRSITSGGAGL